MRKSIHRAKYVLAEPGLLLENAAVHISSSGRIVRVGIWHLPPPHLEVDVVDWGSAVILPGLINAHAHLELTSLHNQLTHFRSFTDWILQLVNRRRTWRNENYRGSARDGARMSLASGTTLVGDITSSGVGWDAAKSEHLRRVVFEEVIALSPGKAGQTLAQLNLLFKRSDPNPLLIHGVSPHSPYSVSPQLYRRAAKFARSHGVLLATHTAETRAELEFLQTGRGEFRDFLGAIGALPANWKPPGLSPVSYLDSLGVLGRSCLLIHCNYLDQESISRISSTRSSVVYCPRSHSFFGHRKHPIRHLLDSGVNVALGTDSLASNSSLSMIDEMRWLSKTRKDIKAEEIFRAATLSGASALGFGHALGRLRRGCRADMAVLELPQNLKPRRLPAQILEGAGDCLATVVQGSIAWKRET